MKNLARKFNFIPGDGMIFVPNKDLPFLKPLTIASRKSDLARLQAYKVGAALLNAYPSLQIKYHFRDSLGDINLKDPLWKMPEKGVFTEDFYQDLALHKVDMVVHSWKDLPIEDKEKTFISATLDREDPRDVLLFKRTSHGKKKITIFTSSPRRIYNLESFFSWSLPWKVEPLHFLPVRGNVQTRVRKLMESSDPEIDGLIVAKAALDRLISTEEKEFQETRNYLKQCLAELLFQVIPLSQNPTAAAQGALAIEIAKDRPEVHELLQKINNQRAYHNTSLERNILKKYGGGCHQKIGISILNKQNEQVLFLKGLTDTGHVLNETTLMPSEKLTQKSTGLSGNLTSAFNGKLNGKFLAPHAQSEKKIQPLSYDLDSFYKDFSDKNKTRFIFITKDENIQGLRDTDILWTSGVSTWKKLAKSGHWVCGSFDSLGEEQPPEISYLSSSYFDLSLDQNLDQKIKWIKITHAQGKESSWATKCPAYAISYQEKDLHYDPSVEFYYWSHGELFKKYYQMYPEIKNKFHSCGLGSTLDTLRNFLPKDHIIPCFNYEDWLSKKENQ